YYFSGGRAQLLDQYYDVAPPHGETFIVYHSTDHHLDTSKEKWEWYVDEHGPENWVTLKNGNRQRLEEYLWENYPSVFSLVEAGANPIFTKVLVMTKDPARPTLGLSRRLKQRRIWFPPDPKPSMVGVPSGEWQEVR